ncbi:PRTRC system protein B [uncultured Thiodictyon sp.]|uniref:PRTRC system protein B n=1 Tax=uncultured Thiodictyon sp. TaxID=1846217 RepID=UPI0025FD865E|nr:PRTRC system protein B [uncultured Thiodictyon sp.]
MPLTETMALPSITTTRPTGAIVFHEQRREGGGGITYHPLDDDAQGTRILPGRPLTVADARALLESLLGERTSELRWTPPNVLASGDEALVWSVPGTVRPMLFRGKKDGPIRLDVPWPTLVFAATDGAIRLAAIKSRGRPTARTPLFHAPLWNVYADGRVCLGSATVPPLDGIDAMPAYESAIFDTLFSHGNFRGNLAYRQDHGETSDRDHLRFWRELALAKTPRFPNAVLVPMGQRLATWLGLERSR